MSNLNWKVFLISLVLTFIWVLIAHTGIRVPQLAVSNNLISPKLKVTDIISPKLSQISNNFRITSQSGFVQTAQATGEFNNASAYALINFDTGEVLAQKSMSEPLPIASLTKIMTAVVALDLADPNEMVTVSEGASKTEPTNMGLVPGQKWSIEELLHGLLMTSSNDTAQAIAEGINSKYGQNVFVSAMNKKAQFLHLTHTHFENPQGYDGSSHYSSAEDLAILAHYALANYPKIAEIVKRDYQFFPSTETHKQADLYNWNGLLGVYPGVYGLKIGNTEKAGVTTIVASERAGKRLLVVVLGAQGILNRDLYAAELLDLGFEKFGSTPVNVTQAQLKAKYATWKYF